MFTHKNCEEAIQLLMDHNGRPQLHVCSNNGHTASPNKIEKAKVEIQNV